MIGLTYITALLDKRWARLQCGQHSAEGQHDGGHRQATSPEHGVKGVHDKVGCSMYPGYDDGGDGEREQRSDQRRDQNQHGTKASYLVTTQRGKGHCRRNQMNYHIGEE